MKKDQLKRLLFVAPAFMVILLYYIVSTQKTMDNIKHKVNRSPDAAYLHLISVVDIDGDLVKLRPGKPFSVSREVVYDPTSATPALRHSNCFALPPMTLNPLLRAGENSDGSVGPCNVNMIGFVPHAHTHLETSAHILATQTNPPTVTDIPPENLTGLVYLIDLSDLKALPGAQIPVEVIKEKLEANRLPIGILAIKTRASLLPQDHDFTGRDFLSLSAEAATYIHDYRFQSTGEPPVSTRIDCLIVDLPSVDPETDKKMFAHRSFFGLPFSGFNAKDEELRAIVELAWFPDLKEGYYHAFITPPQIRIDAVATGVVFQPLH
ncbi:MAG: hypothetical protein GY765_14945 [bacterium]|nr:hypothetical protein [bacterium]